MIVWVDDILSFSNTDTENDRIEKELKSKFEVNNDRKSINDSWDQTSTEAESNNIVSRTFH